ncbi:hypothetical protein ACFORG_05540 [Lutimaribacter marinistellae]|uniref:Uncharacterized protein n=1 Tax=Lutimaribacter marinistellae TaxID=1820329 RepID=A0ABV7TEK6_9RHOB
MTTIGGGQTAYGQEKKIDAQTSAPFSGSNKIARYRKPCYVEAVAPRNERNTHDTGLLRLRALSQSSYRYQQFCMMFA